MTRAKDISKILTDANISGTLDVTGETTLATHLNLGDNDKIKLGAGSDLQIYHNGSASYISEQGTGNLVLGAADSIIFQNAAHDENMLVASQNGAVSLYHDNSVKLATSANGINITGDDLRISNDDGQAIIRSDDTSGSGATDYGDITFKGFRATSDETTPLFLDGATAKVGIGTTAPVSLSGNADPGLTIKSNGPYILLQDANNANTIRYMANNDGLYQMGIVNDDGSSNKTEQFRIASDGKTKITSLAGSDYALRVHNDRNNNDGYGICVQVGTDAGTGTHYQIDFKDGDGTLQGSISSDSGTVTYGPFTAYHPCIIPDSDNDADSVDRAYPYGTLLEITSLSYTQKNGDDTERGILYNVQKSSSAKSKAVIGAYGSSMNSADRGDTNLHQALILGDGHILCNNENGNIAIGDYICTSSTNGEGMKATNICTTIGIAREAVTFSNSTAVLVAVEYGYRQFIPEDLEARITALEG